MLEFVYNKASEFVYNEASWWETCKKWLLLLLLLKNMWENPKSSRLLWFNVTKQVTNGTQMLIILCKDIGMS